MTEKYIDLAQKISLDWGYMSSEARHALSWLDEHPDQVPGRTITESDYSDITEWARNWNHLGYQGREVLAKAGITIVPDPEPTNAEKLGAIIAEKFQLEYRGDPNDALGIGRYLDEAGVKAPGGDE